MLEHFKRNKEVTQVGILVKDVRPSVLTYGLTEFSRKNPDIDLYIYIDDWKTPPSSINRPMMQYRNCYGFEGTLISTDIETTRFMLEVPNTCIKIFYIWNIDEYRTLPDINNVLDIFSRNDIQYICRSTEYANIIGSNFNVNPKVCTGLDSADFLTIITNKG